MRWTHKKRRRTDAASAVSEEPPVTLASVVSPQLLRSDTLDLGALMDNMPRQLSHQQLARLLWMPDYWPIFVLMLGQFSDTAESLAELFASVENARRRGHEVDRATMLRLMSTLASIVQGEESIRTLPFSLVAKSISFLMQQVPTPVWAIERKQRQLLSVGVLRSVLAEMVLCKTNTIGATQRGRCGVGRA